MRRRRFAGMRKSRQRTVEWAGRDLYREMVEGDFKTAIVYFSHSEEPVVLVAARGEEATKHLAEWANRRPEPKKSMGDVPA